MIKVLEALAGRLSENPQEFVSSLYKDENKEEMIEESAIISKLESLLSAKITAHNDDQRKRGIKEGRKAFENAIKAKGFDSDLKGVDLFDAFYADIQQKPTDNDKGLTKEAAAKLQVVKELLDERLQAASNKLKQTETEFSDFKKSTQLSQLKTVAQKRAIEILEKNRVILEAENIPKSKRLDTIFNLIDYNALKVEGENVVLLDDEGDVKKDIYGNAVSFEDYVLEKNPFQIRTQDPSRTSPPPKVPGTPPTGNVIVRDEAHFVELMQNPKLSGPQRSEIMKAWDEKQNS